MHAAVALVLYELLGWVAERPRGYAETMAVWRTSCPRLPAWEDALELGLVRLAPMPGSGMQAIRVVLTMAGEARLRDRVVTPAL